MMRNTVAVVENKDCGSVDNCCEAFGFERILTDIMNEDDFQYFRERLLAQRREVQGDIQRHGQIPTERVDAEDNDYGDQANVAVERDLLQALAGNEDHLCEKIDHALNRIDQATYGICASCGDTIRRARLEAKPSVSLCLACQNTKEHS